MTCVIVFFFSSRRRHTRFDCDWSSDVCSSDLDHYLEEPGNLEIEYSSTFGTQRGGNDFHAYWAEFAYGVKAWWTTEFYLDGQTTFGDSTIFTGIRWENRVRPLKREHFINPVLYVEYENIKGTEKILKEVEGHDIDRKSTRLNSSHSQISYAVFCLKKKQGQ